MTEEQKIKIIELRNQGLGYKNSKTIKYHKRFSKRLL